MVNVKLTFIHFIKHVAVGYYERESWQERFSSPFVLHCHWWTSEKPASSNIITLVCNPPSNTYHSPPVFLQYFDVVCSKSRLAKELKKSVSSSEIRVIKLVALRFAWIVDLDTFLNSFQRRWSGTRHANLNVRVVINSMMSKNNVDNFAW